MELEAKEDGKKLASVPHKEEHPRGGIPMLNNRN
jgi:hypothetical protein